MDGRLCNSRINLQKSIVLTESQKKILSSHAKKSTPNESCALLFGEEKDGKSIVNEVFLTENIDDSQVNFTISNQQLLDGYKTAEKKGMDVVGIFHSHPNSDAFPSKTDQKFMQVNPVVWVIFSGTSNVFKAFILESEIIEISID